MKKTKKKKTKKEIIKRRELIKYFAEKYARECRERKKNK